jgi:UDP-N-acetyl-2-amino-2-deoxyglucuronate dehydrogenase
MAKSLKFGLIGAAGFVAPRHMAAIKAIGGELVAACDPHDSVGILDSYFPECRYFTDPKQFYTHCVGRVAYISICTPNHWHEHNCKMALQMAVDAICEKPLTMNESSVDRMSRCAQRLNGNIWPILQLRCHPAVVEWKDKHWIPDYPKRNAHQYKVEVEYYTPRGPWYHESWKGSEIYSGGILLNIGIHLFDLCHYLFGKRIDSHGRTNDVSANGFLKLESADVKWALTIDRHQPRRRIFRIDGEDLDLSKGFHTLHVKMYKKIVSGESWTIEDAQPAISTCQSLMKCRTQP